MSQLSAVTTDASGRLTSWQEGIYKVTVRRDSAGRPIVARAVGPGKALTSEFKYSAANVFTGLVGNFESALLGTLVAEASRGGAVAVGASTDLTGGIGIQAAGVQIGGDASPHAFTTRALTVADNGMVLTCASSQTATVNSGLAAGFGVAVKGTVSFTAGGGVTITDLRSTGAASPWCALTATGTDTYDVLGNKA